MLLLSGSLQSRGRRDRKDSSEPGQRQHLKESLCLKKERASLVGEGASHLQSKEAWVTLPLPQKEKKTKPQGHKEETKVNATKGNEGRATEHLLLLKR